MKELKYDAPGDEKEADGESHKHKGRVSIIAKVKIVRFVCKYSKMINNINLFQLRVLIIRIRGSCQRREQYKEACEWAKLKHEELVIEF